MYKIYKNYFEWKPLELLISDNLKSQKNVVLFSFDKAFIIF